jgi:glycosyltransferase involved in cell wall biosynthesis
VPRIAALGHEVIISSPHSFAGSPLDWKGFRIIPAAGDAMGNDIIAANYRYYQADLLLTLCDTFKLLPSARALAGISAAHWAPVDCSPMGRQDIAVFRDGTGIPVAMTRFGERMMRDEGLEPHYVPHGVDTDVFRPGSRGEVRASLGFADDMFVIGICAMNRDPVRKGLAEQVTAFRAFWENHPQSRLMMHTSPVSEALNLEALARSLGFPQGIVMFPDRYSLSTGLIGAGAMCAWYCGLDVLSACSYGEGFCVPALEAAACGVPVIATGFSGCGEMCLSGWKIPGSRHWVSGHEAWWRRPEVADIAAAYEKAWQARENGEMPGMGAAARTRAEAFSAGRVTAEFWEPCLAGIEADLKGGLWPAAPSRSSRTTTRTASSPPGEPIPPTPPGWCPRSRPSLRPTTRGTRRWSSMSRIRHIPRKPSRSITTTSPTGPGSSPAARRTAARSPTPRASPSGR